MLEDLNSFKRELRELGQHLLFLDAVERTLRSGNAPNLIAHANRAAERPRYEHSAFVISLYVAFERLLESLMISYVGQIGVHIKRYQEISETTKNVHLALSLQLLTRFEDYKFREPTSVQDIIGNLYSCLSERNDYRLNVSAFTLRSGNFRPEKIDEFFSRVGIAAICKRVRENHSLKRVYQTLTQKFLLQTSGSGNELSILENFVATRNDVAHGELSELFSRKAQKQLITYFALLGKCFYQVVESEIINLEISKSAVPLVKPFHVFRKNIACLKAIPSKLQVGASVYIKNSMGDFNSAKIISIKMDDVSYESLDPTEANSENGVAVALNRNVTRGCALLILPLLDGIRLNSEDLTPVIDDATLLPEEEEGSRYDGLENDKLS